MIDPLLPVGDGHTALSDEDLGGLIPTDIATRGDLFDAEQRNIADALVKLRSPTAVALLDDIYVRRLHEAMFGQVWKWAGRYRTVETNIGVDPALISMSMHDLVRDVRAWVADTVFAPDEIAIRFRHRLVHIPLH